jgi:hypothetical protein
MASATARLGHFWKVQVGQFWRAPKRDAAESGGELRIARSGPRQGNVSTAYGSTGSVGAPGERDQDDGGPIRAFLADVKPCIGERSAQAQIREPRFWAFSAENNH